MAKIKGVVVVNTERCKGCNLCVYNNYTFYLSHIYVFLLFYWLNMSLL